METRRSPEDIQLRISGDERFQEISKENLGRFEKLHSEIIMLRKRLLEKEDLDLLVHLERERDKCSKISIVFAAMCLEAFIYDYAATATSDSYVKKYLDKLDLVSKWIIVPRIITGKEIPRGSKALQMLSKLIAARNSLIHFKSRTSTWDDSFLAREEDLELKMVENTRNAYPTIGMLMKELRKIDPAHPRSLGHELNT